MLLKLVIPGLCGPLPDITSLINNASCQSLAKTLSRADQFQHVTNGFEAELAALFGMNHADPVPSALFSLLGSGQKTGDGYWFHADPVHLQTDLDRAILRDSNSLDLTKDQAEALVQSVNDYFSEDGLRIIAMDANRWYLNIENHNLISTTPVHEVIGRNVKFFMPKGEDEVFWRRFMNETQMLFHMHEVNQQRENKDQLPVNSLWVWGEGALPKNSETELQQVFSNHVLLKGMAEHHGISCRSIDGISSLLDAMNRGESTMIVMDDLFNVACYGDTVAWLKMLESLYQNWIDPLLNDAFKHGFKIELYPCNGVRYAISGKQRFRVFRRSDIKQHVRTYE